MEACDTSTMDRLEVEVQCGPCIVEVREPISELLSPLALYTKP